MNNEIVVLLNKIWMMEGESISEKILDYCETYDFDPQEVGDILSESDDFKALFFKNCVETNIIKDDDFKATLIRTQEVTPW